MCKFVDVVTGVIKRNVEGL